jgi:hypothetical protein
VFVTSVSSLRRRRKLNLLEAVVRDLSLLSTELDSGA